MIRFAGLHETKCITFRNTINRQRLITTTSNQSNVNSTKFSAANNQTSQVKKNVELIQFDSDLNTFENQKKFLNLVSERLNIKDMSDWYKVTQKVLEKLQLSS
jgi:hypothetical protein